MNFFTHSHCPFDGPEEFRTLHLLYTHIDTNFIHGLTSTTSRKRDQAAGFFLSRWSPHFRCATMTTMVPNTSLLPFGRCRVPKTLFLSMALGVLFCSQLWILSDVDRVENGRGTKDTKTVRDRRNEDAAIVLEVLSQRSRRTKPRSQPSLSQPNEGGAEVVVGVSGSSATRVSSHSKATTTTTDGGDATAANIRSQSSSTSTEQETAVTTAAATPATTTTPSQSSAENTTTTHNQTMVSTPANNNKNNNTTKKLFRFMSSVMNFSCSAPYTLLPGSYPTPLNVSSFSSSNGKDGRHITCSMGCTNVTLPNHFPSFIIVRTYVRGVMCCVCVSQ